MPRVQEHTRGLSWPCGIEITSNDVIRFLREASDSMGGDVTHLSFRRLFSSPGDAFLHGELRSMNARQTPFSAVIM
jgi:hypothetical protein